jgi:putative hydrolase of the HAD superfamily
MKKISTILFDADGVLIYPWRFANYLEKEHQLSRSDTAPFFTGEFEKCLRGKADLKDVLLPYLDRWHWKHSSNDFIKVWHEVENEPDRVMLGAVQELRRQGYICCLATNQEKYRAKYIKDDMKFGSKFDHLFFSCELFSAKPDMDYYKKITGCLHTPPENMLFWDDSKKHVSAAKDFGWHAERYVNFVDFKRRLRSYDIDIVCSGTKRH